MPLVIIPSDVPALDGPLRTQAWSFLERLRRDDTAPSLGIAPVEHAADQRVRTGQVDSGHRAVLIKLAGSDAEPRYVYLGAFERSEAIQYATNVVFRRNPGTGAAEVFLTEAALTESPDVTDEPARSTPDVPVLQAFGTTFEDLIDLGIAPKTAYQAIHAADRDRLQEIATTAPTAYQTDALVMLGDGATRDQVRETYRAAPVEVNTAGDTDDELIGALDHPASRMEFTYLVDDAALRAAIEDEDFARWRVFLHPEQRTYVETRTSGAFRLSGGAGTGKTVVLLHRARHLHRANPAARILLTTYNRTLAATLRANLKLLDPNIELARQPGDPGVHVGTVDSVAWHLLARPERHGLDIPRATERLLGVPRSDVVETTAPGIWEAALRSGGDELPATVRNTEFFATEYGTVVLPTGITLRDHYLRARRPGRGTALGRAQRAAVWTVISTYRRMSAASGAADHDEKAMIAATALDAAGSRVADHVLVDEAQDLTATRIALLRALVTAGPDDLFLAEDSQQRIYAPRTVLSRHGIHVTGRSRRLRLNYRTTQQNLGYATAVLAGQEIVDLEDTVVDGSGLRSARTGPPPSATGRDTLDAARGTAVDTIRGWLAGQVPPETIAVLVRNRHEAADVARQLARDSIPAQHVGPQDTPRDGRVVVMTMHRSKGMEFRNVLVLGTTARSTNAATKRSDGNEADALQRERSLLYVATTRARERIALVWHGDPSEFLPAPRAQAPRVIVVDQHRAAGTVDHQALAQEMHDGVGHSLAQISLQASVLEVATDPTDVRETAARIRAAARQAGVELRGILDIIRTGAAGLTDVSFDDLVRLLERLTLQGARITSDIAVTAGDTADTTLTRACYRIVQESVTNALRHAPGLPIDITLRAASATGVRIIVHNPMPHSGSDTAMVRTRSGISGMTDRATSLGGTLTAAASGGSFVVDARLPWNVRPRHTL